MGFEDVTESPNLNKSRETQLKTYFISFSDFVPGMSLADTVWVTHAHSNSSILANPPIVTNVKGLIVGGMGVPMVPPVGPLVGVHQLVGRWVCC